MIAWNGIIDDLIDHVNMLQEMGARSVEMDPELLRALVPEPAAAQPLATTSEKRQAKTQAVKSVQADLRQPGVSKAENDPAECAAAMSAIAARIAACEACPLHKDRTQTVPGQGNINTPDIMFVAEAPGVDEDRQGVPFVGAAGQFLNKMIAAMGYKREEVFITNICKCRPPNNRTPQTDEMKKCLPFLQEQICAVRPKVLFLLGNTAIKGLLGGSAMRGQWSRFNGIPVMSTYHPSYIIRFERSGDDVSMKRAKREVWHSCKLVLAQLGKPVPAPPPGRADRQKRLTPGIQTS